MRYYITIDEEDTIWGAGTTKKASLADARDCIKRILKTDHIPTATIRCTKEVYDDVCENGYCHDTDLHNNIPYWEYDYATDVAYYPEKLDRENVFNYIEFCYGLDK